MKWARSREQGCQWVMSEAHYRLKLLSDARGQPIIYVGMARLGVSSRLAIPCLLDVAMALKCLLRLDLHVALLDKHEFLAGAPFIPGMGTHGNTKSIGI